MEAQRHLICNLAALMAERGIPSLTYLSNKSGLSRVSLDRCYYNKSTRLDFSTAIKLCQALECEVDELYILVDQDEYQKMQRIEQTRENRLKSGYVYFIKNPSNGLIKIGRSKDVDLRLYQLSYELKQSLELIGKTYYEDSVTAEKELHQVFADRRKNGEWFDIKIEDVYKIKEENK